MRGKALDEGLEMLLPIHPFPARMAPDLALAEVGDLPAGSLVLDPMAGSGTVLRVAAERGHRAVGFDMDPLAVLMARVWTTPLDGAHLRAVAAELVERVEQGGECDVSLPWIDEDPETCAFVAYWFAEPQRAELRRLSAALRDLGGPMGDALRLALSRIIVTKDHGASLARDVSHSRPHRVRTTNDFPVLGEFLRSVRRLAHRLEEQPPPGRVTVAVGDARRLSSVASASVDAVITSPPYLNAIDYMRGHRLTLVWLGHRLRDLRSVRAESIGAERGPTGNVDLALARGVTATLGALDGLPGPERRMVDRYVLDVVAMLGELHRVLRIGAKLVLIVGNSSIRGVFVTNAAIVVAAARRVGFALVSEDERPLPPNRRYLPPPEKADPSRLEKRMRSETLLAFRRESTSSRL
jgi:hypothetical protein